MKRRDAERGNRERGRAERMRIMIGMDIHCKKTVYLVRDKAWRIVGRGSGRGLLMGLLGTRVRKYGNV